MSLGNALRLAVLLALLAGGLLAWRSGALARLDVDALRDWLRAAGPAGVLLYVVAFSIVQPLHVSAYLFIISASLVWSLPEAMVLSWVGVLGAEMVLFAFSRFLAHEWVQGRVPARFRRYEARLETSGFRTVLLLRLLFFATPALQMALGVSRVRARDFALASALGNVPWIVFGTVLGARVPGWLAG